MIPYIKARNLSIQKWQWIVDNWNYELSNHENWSRMIKAIPELETLDNYCGWCEYNLKSSNNFKTSDCFCCALRRISKRKSCFVWYRIFVYEGNANKERHENAIKILNACKAIPEVEDETDKS